MRTHQARAACRRFIPIRSGLAEDLLALVPGSGERRVYLGHAGSDANDVALRACRHATGGAPWSRSSTATTAASASRWGSPGYTSTRAPCPTPMSVFLPYPNPFRPADGDIDADVTACLDLADKHLATGAIACLIVEPILSDGGLVVPPDGFLARLHDRCRRHGVPMICDEVKMGLGRPGTLHAFEHDGVVPDIVTFGKVLGGGLPLSAAVGPAAILDAPPAAALLTTAGNPVCTAAGRAVLATIVAEQSGRPRGESRCGTCGCATRAGRITWRDRIGEVRGRGLAIGLELVDPRPATVIRGWPRRWSTVPGSWARWSSTSAATSWRSPRRWC